jgi:hypothetical protein
VVTLVCTLGYVKPNRGIYGVLIGISDSAQDPKHAQSEKRANFGDRVDDLAAA